MNTVTLPQYFDNLCHRLPAIPNNLCRLIEQVATACCTISQLVSQGALANVLGSQGTENVQGEVQKKLDVISNTVLLEALETSGLLAAMASEEMEDIYPISKAQAQSDYLLLFDPLDGSSNIDVNVSIGTIFSILKKPGHSTVQQSDFLQAGTQQLAAGYVVYGPQTLLVLTLGHGVAAFTLDPSNETWVLTQDNIQIPKDTAEFAINVSNQRHWHAPVQRYIEHCLAGKTGPLEKDYNMRWIASMVADVHRILMRGGIFLYPSDTRPSVQKGKLRLMYEANPMSFIVEQAGGAAINGQQRILELKPEQLHQRTSVILGSENEVKRVLAYHQA